MTTAVSRFTKEATLRRTSSSGVDEYGNPALVESTQILPCHVRPLSSSETADGIESERWKLYLPPGTSLSASDRVAVDGLIFEVVSVPSERYNPRTSTVEAVSCELEVTSSERAPVEPEFYGGGYS